MFDDIKYDGAIVQDDAGLVDACDTCGQQVDYPSCFRKDDEKLGFPIMTTKSECIIADKILQISSEANSNDEFTNGAALTMDKFVDEKRNKWVAGEEGFNGRLIKNEDNFDMAKCLAALKPLKPGSPQYTKFPEVPYVYVRPKGEEEVASGNSGNNPSVKLPPGYVPPSHKSTGGKRPTEVWFSPPIQLLDTPAKFEYK